MSATIVRLTFAVSVRDADAIGQHAPELLDAIGDDPPEDWVSGQLDRVMLAAGQAWVDEHRGLFRTAEIV